MAKLVQPGGSVLGVEKVPELVQHAKRAIATGEYVYGLLIETELQDCCVIVVVVVLVVLVVLVSAAVLVESC